jgi:hypothetical protein
MSEYNIREMMSGGVDATGAFQFASLLGDMPIYFPAGVYDIDADIIFSHRANPITIRGDGCHASIIRFTDTNFGLRLDQRDDKTLGNFDNWQVDISNIGIQYADTKHGPPGSSAVSLWGRGTSNTIEPILSFRRVQFGRPDRRNPGTQAYPGTWEYYPETWIDVSGVFGAEFVRCNFGGQIQGPLDMAASYYPQAGIRFTDNAGEFTEINGQRLMSRSMGNHIVRCRFGPMRIGVECAETHHVEGTRISGDFVGGWKGIHIRGDQHHNTQLVIRDTHIAFRRAGIDVEAGAHVVLADNSLIARSDGFFDPTPGEPHPHFIRLGEAGANHGVVLGTVSGTTFGRAPNTAPATAVVVDGASAYVHVGANHYQGAMQRVKVVSDQAHDVFSDGARVA